MLFWKFKNKLRLNSASMVIIIHRICHYIYGQYDLINTKFLFEKH